MVKQWYCQNVQYGDLKYRHKNSTKSILIKKQKASEILSNLGLKTPSIKIALLGNILFWMQFHWTQLH